MKVLHVTLSLVSGGRLSAIASLVEGLRQLGVDSVLGSLDEADSLPELATSLNCEVLPLARRWLLDPSVIRHLRDFCRERRVDIIHTHDAASQFTAAVAALRLRNIPLVMTFHRSLGMESASPGDVLRNAFAGTQCGAIIVGSQERRDRFIAENLVPPRKVVRIPFGTDLSRFHPDPQLRASARSELGVPLDMKLVGTVGHFGPEKGVDIAIRAFQGLARRPSCGRVALVIFGEGSRRAELEKIAKSSPSPGPIRFVGYRQNMNRYMNAMDVLLHTPRLEAFGLVLIEAMATGLPIVASRTGGIPDIVRDGITGFLAESEEPDSLARVLEPLLSDPKLRPLMGQEARRIALAEYGRELYAQRHLLLYEDLLAGHRPRVEDTSGQFRPVEQPVRMKVLHVNDSMEMGGAEKLVLQLCHLHRDKGYDVAVYCLSRLGVLGEQLQREGFSVRVGAGHFLPRAAWDIRRVLREEKPDVVHCHNATAAIVAAPVARAFGAHKIIVTRHGLVGAPIRRGREIKFALASHFCDWVVGVCDATTQNLRKLPLVDRRHLISIYNGTQGIEGASRSSFPKSGPFRLVHVGRLAAEKDQASLLKAVAIAGRRIPDLKLVIVGDGELRSALEKLTAELGINRLVEFTGEQSDVSRFLHEADVFVLSSVSEGLPVSLLEALSCGLPAVVTDIGGMPEVVRDCAGLVVPARDPEAFAQAIVFLHDHPERLRSFREGALRRYQKSFTPETMADEYARLYGDVRGTVRRTLQSSSVGQPSK